MASTENSAPIEQLHTLFPSTKLTSNSNPNHPTDQESAATSTELDSLKPASGAPSSEATPATQGADEAASTPRPPRVKVLVDNDTARAESVRQVEYYFSDQNLVNDPHLLSLIEQDPEGTVNIGRIFAWPRMRQYTPRSAVVEALKKSDVLEVVQNNKRIKRKIPFDMAKALVEPQMSEQDVINHRKNAHLNGAPGLSKGMLDLTGFEHHHHEPSLTPKEIKDNLQQYSQDRPHWDRAEKAIYNFRSKRKFHEGTAHLFDAFLQYGGIESRESAFTGGQDTTEEDLTKEDIALRRQKYFVADEINDSIDAEDGKWVIDFEGTVKGFLSTRFPQRFTWCGEGEKRNGTVKAACNVLRNFFNYLLHHNVFPEFTGQIVKAHAAVNLAEKEFPLMAKAQENLPGDFGTACSCVMGGWKAGVRMTGNAEWMTEEEASLSQIGYSDKDAERIIMAGLAAWYPENARKAKAAIADARDGKDFVDTEETGLEVVRIAHPHEASDDAKEIFKRLEGTAVPRMGKLICKRFHFPQDSEEELLMDPPPGYNNFEFLLDEEALKHCFAGMKIDAVVKKLNCGIAWIDHVHKVYGSFFEWCWNEDFGRAKKESKRAWSEKWNHADCGEDRVPKPDNSLDGYEMDDDF